MIKCKVVNVIYLDGCEERIECTDTRMNDQFLTIWDTDDIIIIPYNNVRYLIITKKEMLERLE
jgi:hypothetical protein